MISKAVPQLLEVRQLRFHREQDVLRVRQLALDQAVAAAELALTDLGSWQQDRRRLEDAIYHSLIGETIALSDLLGLKEKIVSLHEHERLLERRVQEAVVEADQALQARDEAHKVARHLYNKFHKCEHLLQALRDGDLRSANRTSFG
ncbi:type III secretion system stalk subunit SctO [Bradyrhizobium genosp. P]|uniref:type III secretion system stalk subunit SctO n=1 Tax=Bradyrhizobium genosp. P TaxID=83641 RepID=UPI003CF864C1